MKRKLLSMAAMALICAATMRIARAGNDRHITAAFTNGTSTVLGATQVTLDLAVTNDINNLQFPSHFIQSVQVTIPAGFSGSAANGAFQASDFIPPAGWSVASVAAHTITFIAGSTDYTFVPGTNRTFLLKVHTPAAAGCPGASLAFTVSAAQTAGGGNGNAYPYRPGATPPTVTVTNCVTPTFLTLNSVNPGSIFTTGNSQIVTLTATLNVVTGFNNGVPALGASIPNEPVTFLEGGQAIACMGIAQGMQPMTNSSGVASCQYTPLTGPITPLPAGSYDDSAYFNGDSAASPLALGSATSSSKQLTVSATDTNLTVQSASAPFGGTVNLSATLVSGLGQTVVVGQTIVFSLGGVQVCGLNGLPACPTTDGNGVANLNNVSIGSLAGGVYDKYIGGNFAGNGTYGTAANSATLTVNQVDQIITFNVLADQPFVAQSIGISATDSASLLVTFTSNTTNICSVGSGSLSGSTTNATVSFLALGLCSITASQNGDISHGAATPVTQTFNIITTMMSCTLGNMSVPFTGAAQSPTCTAGAGGASCKADNAPYINVGSYPENAVSLTSGYACTGPGNTGMFVIGKANQATLSLVSTSPLIFNQSETLSTTGGTSGGAVTYSVVSGACGINGSQLTANSGTGTCTVSATMAGGANYNDVTSAQVIITLAKANQTALTVNAGSPLTYGASETLTVSGGSTGGTVTYTFGTGPCTLTGAQLKADSGTGSCTASAMMAGNANYNNVISALATVTLQKAIAPLSFSNTSQTYTGAPLSPTLNGVPAGITPTLLGYPATDVGNYPISATISDLNYSGYVADTFHITAAAQTITFTSFIVSAKATAGGTVTFSSGTPTICTVTATVPAQNQSGDYTAVATLIDPNTDWTKCKVLSNAAATANFTAAPQSPAVLGDPLAP